MSVLNLLKFLVKKNSFFSGLFFALRKTAYNFFIKRYQGLPVNNKRVLLNSFNGKGFGDNPRAIAEYLHKQKADLELLWCVSGQEAASSLPTYVKPVVFNSLDYYKALSTAKVWIFNVLVPDGTLKRAEQLYIQTWHGDRALKKILNDAAQDNAAYKKFSETRRLIEDEICDYFVAGSTFGTKMIRSAFGYTGKILEVGSPRNDCLFSPEAKTVAALKENLGLNSVKILLYAPTFRDHALSSEFITSEINLEKILELLEQRDNCEWVCLMRAHSGSSIKVKGVEEKTSKLIDVTKYPDIADLMLISDMIISDYSSSATDFILTGKPVIMYQDDYELYTSKDRELYFAMEDSHFWVAHNMEEAAKVIAKITPEAARVNDEQILDFFGAYEDGRATEKVCQVILEHLEK